MLSKESFSHFLLPLDVPNWHSTPPHKCRKDAEELTVISQTWIESKMAVISLTTFVITNLQPLLPKWVPDAYI